MYKACHKIASVFEASTTKISYDRTDFGKVLKYGQCFECLENRLSDELVQFAELLESGVATI